MPCNRPGEKNTIRISDTDCGFLIRIADCGLRIADCGARGPGAGQDRFPVDSPWETAPPLGQADLPVFF